MIRLVSFLPLSLLLLDLSYGLLPSHWFSIEYLNSFYYDHYLYDLITYISLLESFTLTINIQGFMDKVLDVKRKTKTRMPYYQIYVSIYHEISQKN